MKHPMQPLVRDKDGVIRFKENAIVRYLLDAGKRGLTTDLNSLSIMPFNRDDWTQFYQLIGYSVSGYSDIALVSKTAIQRADELAAEMVPVRARAKPKGE